jgi:S-formylglutathione hydrolase
MKCPWGQKALTGYLGDNQDHWRHYDACMLISDGRSSGEILVDQGQADEFLDSQLMPEKFQQVCRDSGQSLRLRLQPGYDHSYYFIASFIGEHVAFHAARLNQ